MVQKKRKRLFSPVTFGFPFMILTLFISFFPINNDFIFFLNNEEGFFLNISKSSVPACILNKKECRFDDIGEYIEESAILTIAHPLSEVLPENRKVSKSEANNVTFMKNTRLIGPSDGSKTPLFEYNPTIGFPGKGSFGNFPRFFPHLFGKFLYDCWHRKEGEEKEKTK